MMAVCCILALATVKSHPGQVRMPPQDIGGSMINKLYSNPTIKAADETINIFRMLG